jgi:hypothetical protein
MGDRFMFITMVFTVPGHARSHLSESEQHHLHSRRVQPYMRMAETHVQMTSEPQKMHTFLRFVMISRTALLRL